MKIALLSNGFRENPKEATGITLWELAVFLKGKGHDVTIISENNEGVPSGISVIEGITVIRFRQVKGMFSRFRNFLWSFIRETRKGRYDVIHSFSSSPVLALRGILGGKGTKARIIHTIKSRSKHKGSFLFSSVLNLCDKVTAPTKYLAKSLIKSGCSSKRLSIVRSPLRLKMFMPGNKSALKARHGYAGKKVIFYYGAFFRNKGVHILAAALPKVVTKVPETILILAPRYKGKEIDSITVQLDRSMKDHYSLLEGDVKIEEIVAMADVVALPYIDLTGTEGNPSCLLEAAASKTPVVTTDLPEIREIMVKGKDVVMVIPGNPDSLAEGLIDILTDRKKAAKIAGNAYKKKDEYDIKKIGDLFLRLYHKAY